MCAADPDGTRFTPGQYPVLMVKGDDNEIQVYDFSGAMNDVLCAVIVGLGNWATMVARGASDMALDLTKDSGVATIQALQVILAESAKGTLIVLFNRCPVIGKNGSNFSAPSLTVCRVLVQPVATALRSLRDGGVKLFFGIAPTAGRCLQDSLRGVWEDVVPPMGYGALRR